MATPMDIKHIVHDPGVLDGAPYIASRSVPVSQIVWWHQQGISPETLAGNYQLSPAEVHAALAYYYEHRDEIDREIEQAARARASGAETNPPALTIGEKRPAADILAEFPGHLLFTTAEEVDAYLREERDPWER